MAFADSKISASEEILVDGVPEHEDPISRTITCQIAQSPQVHNLRNLQVDQDDYRSVPFTEIWNLRSLILLMDGTVGSTVRLDEQSSSGIPMNKNGIILGHDISMVSNPRNHVRVYDGGDDWITGFGVPAGTQVTVKAYGGGDAVVDNDDICGMAYPGFINQWGTD